MLPSVLKSWRIPTLQVPIKAFKDGLQLVSKDNVLTHIQRYLTSDLQAGAIPQSQAVSVRPSSDVNLQAPEYLYFWEKLKKCFGFGSKKEGKGKSKLGKKTKKQTCKSKGKCSKKKDTCLKKKDSNICGGDKSAEKPKADCKPKDTKKSAKSTDACKKDEKKPAIKADPCKKKEEKKADPCKKDDKKEVKKADPCKKKDEKKDDPCKKKEVKKADPCKKKDEKKKEDPCKKKEDPCKKKDEKKEDPCKKKEDPCKKKDEKKEDPCKKKEDPCKKKDEKKEDPCKKKEDPCKKKDEKKEDPCKKKDDPCKKKEDPCMKKDEKKDDPCKKKEDPCKKKEDPCKKKEDPCKKKDEKKEDPCKKKEDPCKKKEDPCKKKEEKKDDPCKKKEDPCKKKDEKKDDPCKKKEDPCKKKDPCGDKFASNETLAMDPILLFSISQPVHKKEEEMEKTCKDPCAQGACDVLPGQDEPCSSSVSWKVKVNPCRQRRSSSSKSRCSSPTACIVDAKAKKEEKLEKGSDCGLVPHPCGKKLCPNRCEVQKKKKFSSVQESFNWGILNFMNVLAGHTVDILSLAVNFTSQRGTPIDQKPPSRNQPGVPGNTPASGNVAQKVSGIIGKIKGFWNGPEDANPPKEKQHPRNSNMPVNTPGRSNTPGRYPTRQRCEGLETKPNGDFTILEDNSELPALPTDRGFVFAAGPPQDDFEKCEDRTPPCPVEIEMPCPKPKDCDKITDDIWSEIDESYGFEKFPFKQEQTQGNPLEVASLRPDDPFSNHRL